MRNMGIPIIAYIIVNARPVVVDGDMWPYPETEKYYTLFRLKKCNNLLLLKLVIALQISKAFMMFVGTTELPIVDTTVSE